MRKRDRLFTAHYRHAEYFLNVLRAADELYQRGGEEVLKALERYKNDLVNINDGFRWASSQENDDLVAQLLCLEYPDAGANILNLRQHPRERIAWLQYALEAARRTSLREAEGVALGNLGWAYKRLGRTLEALEKYEQALSILRVTGPRLAEAKTLGYLGTAYRDLGRTREAIELFEQELSISKELGNRRSESKALNNLGNAYVQVGEYQSAIKCFEVQLKITSEVGDREA